jgi:hypothetical protein
LLRIAAETICVPWLNDDVDSILIGKVDAPGPSIKVCLFGQDAKSRIQTSATILDLIAGIEVSKALSRIASVGVDVVDFSVLGLLAACEGIVVIVSVVAIKAIVISFFIKIIILN